MTDKREIEGTKDRAQDRGQNLIDLVLPDDTEKPFLGDFDTVAGLVVQFMTEINGLCRDLVAGSVKIDAAADVAVEIANRYAVIFLGESNDYQPLPGWNTADGVGRHVVARFGLDVNEVDKGVHTFLMQSGTTLIEAQSAHMKEEITDEAAEFQVEVIRDELIYALLGLPYPADSDE